MSDSVGTPEHELCLAVVRQAVEDLQSTDEVECFEAHEFLFQKNGGWADMRRMYFSLLGLDEDAVQERLAPHYDPPERPEKKWTMLEVLEVLPEVPFKARTIGRHVGLHYSQVTTRLQHLMRLGHVVRVGRGLFIRADCHTAWVASVGEESALEPKHSGSILDVLRTGPKTIREMVFAFDGAVGVEAIQQRLKRAHEQNLVEKEGTMWCIAA